jgi:hypothetical protein
MCKGKFLKDKKLDIQTLLNFLLGTHTHTHTLYTITFSQKVVNFLKKSLGTWEVENGTNLVCTQILSSSLLKRIKWLPVWYPLDKLDPSPFFSTQVFHPPI